MPTWAGSPLFALGSRHQRRLHAHLAAMRRTLILPLPPMRAALTGATTRLPSVVRETLHGAKIVA